MNNLNLKNETNKIIRDSLSLPKDFILKENMKNDDIPGLDSIAWIDIILKVSKKLKIDFKVDKIAEVEDLKSFYKIVEELYINKK